MLTVFGIKQCDTVKKSLKWLKANHIEHQFHDVRVDGLDEEMIQRWIVSLGWEVLVNKRSTTWRKLSDTAKNELSQENVAALLLEQPTLIKRPIVEGNGKTIIGFREAEFSAELNRD